MDKLLGIILLFSIANMVLLAYLIFRLLWFFDDIEGDIKIIKIKTNVVALQEENTFKLLHSASNYLTKLTDVYSELLDCVSNKNDEKDEENS